MASASEIWMALFKEASSLIGLIFNLSIVWVTIKNKSEIKRFKKKLNLINIQEVCKIAVE
jgi:hypothetical protein